MQTAELRNIKSMVVLANNPRVIYDDDFDKLCQSLKDNPQLLEARPIILSNRTGKLIIIAGNQRFKAAIKIGMKLVPSFLMENLTEKQENEITIRDNVNSGKWDYDMLANEWEPLELMEWGLPLPIDFAVPDAIPEDYEVKEKLQTEFKLTIKCNSKMNYEAVKKELDRLKIEYVESDE